MPQVYSKSVGKYIDVPTSVQQQQQPGFKHATQDVRKQDFDAIRPVVIGGRTVKTNETLPVWEPAKLKDPGTLCAKRVENPQQLNYSTDPDYAHDYKAGVAYARTQEAREVKRGEHWIVKYRIGTNWFTDRYVDTASASAGQNARKAVLALKGAEDISAMCVPHSAGWTPNKAHGRS